MTKQPSTVRVDKDETGLLQPELMVYIMFVVPEPTAVTKPVVASTVATERLVLLQLPPASPSLVYVFVAPLQSGEVPLTVPAFAFGLTINNWEDETGLLQPEFTV